MTDEYDGRFPSPLARILGTVAAAFIAIYGAIGVLRNDLYASISKSGGGVHLHGPLAWLCFGRMLMMSLGAVRVLRSGDGKLDFYERRSQQAPIFVIGLVLYVASQMIANWRS
jgi:hypothetical protein